MRAWSRAGLDPPGFWRVTLREFAVIMDGRRLAREDRHGERMELAWTISALRLQGTKLQGLESLLNPRKPTAEQTPDDHLAALRALAEQEGVVMNFRLVKTREELDAEIEERERAALAAAPGEV